MDFDELKEIAAIKGGFDLIDSWIDAEFERIRLGEGDEYET